MSKIQCFGCNEYVHFKRDCPNKKDNRRKERSETHIAEEKGEPEKKLKGEDPKDLYYWRKLHLYQVLYVICLSFIV